MQTLRHMHNLDKKTCVGVGARVGAGLVGASGSDFSASDTVRSSRVESCRWTAGPADLFADELGTAGAQSSILPCVP